MNKLCPSCNFTVGPMVYMPAAGGAINVLYCMNCGWTENITAEQATAFESKNEEHLIPDRQWQLILELLLQIHSKVIPHDTEPRKTARKELAACYVRTRYSAESVMSSLSEGSNRDYQGSTNKANVDLEQDSKG